MTWTQVIQQLQTGAQHKPAAPRYNPRPAGQIVSGSTTELVLQFLKESPGFRTRAQIVWRVQRPRGAVTWALAYLVSLGLVRCVPDAARNARYYRYSFIRSSRSDA